MKIPLITSGCTLALNEFWTSALVFYDRPNILNKRISGVIQLYFYEAISTQLKDLPQYFTYTAVIYEVRKLPELTKNSLSNLISDILTPYDKSLQLNEVDKNLFAKAASGVFICLRILIPRNTSYQKCVEVVVLNKNDNKISFFAIGEQQEYSIAPTFLYDLEWLLSGHMRITVNNFEDADSSSAAWLVDRVFSKLIKWSSNGFINSSQKSLSLIELENYVTQYQELKNKYGKKIIEIWPENTDPLKFVYEDVAIAAYLICLWTSINSDKKPTFLDLGCGNGLLVHILTQEGYMGCGIDVRERKIWNLYPPNTKLVVETITPSSTSVYPDVDWIIGNHSDELTPWIPVMAMRSSYKTNIFLLPCCSYDFSGKKYSRINTSQSQYLEYLTYIEKVCKICGFNVKTDKLRIPSTKKISIVSYGRTYEPNEFDFVDEQVMTFIRDRTGCTSKTKEKWTENFTPRSTVEKVQNCTQLNRDLIQRIVVKVVEILLQEKLLIMGDDNKLWNRGGTLALSEIIPLIEKSDLKQLKDNCGGLQTLLRNHRYIFEVERGCVKLRVPKKFSETNKYKSKICWFLKNHPNGCFNSSEFCAYKHE